MKHDKESNGIVWDIVNGLLQNIRTNYIPSSKDNLKQIIIKVFFIISLVGVIVSSIVVGNHFLTAEKQKNIISKSREIWYGNDEKDNKNQNALSAAKQELLKQNKDFIGWIKIDGTKIDNPIYKTDNDDYYINHNQKRKKSRYGAIFAHSETVITEQHTDKNIVLFGHNMKDSTMFGDLKKLRKLNYFKEHNTIEFTTLYSDTQTYKIYAVFLLNAKKEDDGGRIYNIYRNTFRDGADFDAWSYEAQERSLIGCGVDVNQYDNILTLVTCANDFPDARLVVMARKLRPGESAETDTSAIFLNKNPKYPKKWYEHRGQEYPFK